MNNQVGYDAIDKWKIWNVPDIRKVKNQILALGDEYEKLFNKDSIKQNGIKWERRAKCPASREELYRELVCAMSTLTYRTA